MEVDWKKSILCKTVAYAFWCAQICRRKSHVRESRNIDASAIVTIQSRLHGYFRKTPDGADRKTSNFPRFLSSFPKVDIKAGA